MPRHANERMLPPLPGCVKREFRPASARREVEVDILHRMHKARRLAEMPGKAADFDQVVRFVHLRHYRIARP